MCLIEKIKKIDELSKLKKKRDKIVNDESVDICIEIFKCPLEMQLIISLN